MAEQTIRGSEEWELALLAEEEKDWEAAVDFFQQCCTLSRGTDLCDEATARMWVAVGKFEAAERRKNADSYEVKPLPPATKTKEEEED